MTSKTTKDYRGQFELSDIMKILLMAVLVGASFLAGVLTANHQTGNIIGEVKEAVLETEELLLDEIEANKVRNAVHICLSGLGELRTQLILRNLARDADLPHEKIPTMLRKEVQRICAETDIQNGSQP